MRLSTAGSAVMGTATVSIDGVTPAPLVAIVAGSRFGPAWLDPNTILYQQGGSGSGPWILESYTVSTNSTATVSSSGQNDLAAGRSVWAAFLGGSGVRTSNGLGPFPSGALGDVSTDGGQLVLVNSQATAAGLTVYSNLGVIDLSLPDVVLTNAIVRLRGNVLAYQANRVWTLNKIAGTISYVVRTDEPINWITPVTATSGQTLLLERSERLTLRYANSALGWALPAPIAHAFNPDVMEVSPGVIRAGWSLNSGESPAALMLADLTLSTGACRVATVVAGVLTWADIAPIARTTFSVGPAQGSVGGGMLPRIQQRVINPDGTMTRPWYLALQSLGSIGRTNSAAIAAAPSVAPVPGFRTLTSGTNVHITAATSTSVELAAVGGLDIALDPAQNIVTFTLPSASQGVPYFIPADETFTVPRYQQALFAMSIDTEGALDVDGYLIEVH